MILRHHPSFFILWSVAMLLTTTRPVQCDVSCVTGKFDAGGAGNVTCNFGENVRDTKHNFNIVLYTNLQNSGTYVLLCNWGMDGRLECNHRQNYRFDQARIPVTDSLVLEIPAVTEAVAGLYVCQLVPDNGIPVHTCQLNVTDPPPTTPPPCTAGTTSNPLTANQGTDAVHHVRSLHWSPQSLQDHDTVFACVGKDLALPWNVTLGPGEQIVDIQWYFHGHSDEMIAFSSHGLFVPLPAFSGGRVDSSPNAGIVLHHVTSADAGLYSVEINGRGADGSSLFTLNRTATVIVSGNLLTSDGAVHIQMNETAVHDKADDDFHVILTCGHFTHSTFPPFDVEWQTPNGQNVSSTSYGDGQFYLELDNPVAGGQYTCRVPLTSAQHSCVHHDVESTLTVDKVDVRLTLLEAENNHLKELRAQDAQDISHLQNQLDSYITETARRHVSFHAVAVHSGYGYSNGQVIPFNPVTYNEGNAFDASSNQFRVPYKGSYFFIVTTTAHDSIGNGHSNEYNNVEIVVDGTMACRIHSTIYMNVGTCQTVVALNVGQKVWVRAFENSVHITEESYFSGFLINTRS